MRINKFIAQNSSLSRRAADVAIENGRVKVNQVLAKSGQQVETKDIVSIDGKNLVQKSKFTTILMNKPVGFVCSKNGQGSKTIYNLLPEKFHNLNTVGRLDKDSSGLLMLTDDGDLANQLTHPKFQKKKIYEVRLLSSLDLADLRIITQNGVELDDGLSKFEISKSEKNDNKNWLVTIYEGRNRQIRRTFEKIGNQVIGLERIQFANYKLSDLKNNLFIEI